MKEIPQYHLNRLIDLACYVQICMRRARMESPLNAEHSARLGKGIEAAEKIEEIGRRVLSGKFEDG